MTSSSARNCVFFVIKIVHHSMYKFMRDNWRWDWYSMRASHVYCTLHQWIINSFYFIIACAQTQMIIHSFCNFAAHDLIGSFERRVSTTSREHILAEKNIWEFLVFRGYIKHFISKMLDQQIFLHSGWWRWILNSDSCTYLKQKTSNVKVSFFKQEVDKIYTKHKFSSNNYWPQFESISIDIKHPQHLLE